MWENLREKLERLKQRLPGASPALTLIAPVTIAIGILISVRSCELTASRRAEVQSAQFAYSKDLAQKLANSTHELAVLLQNSADNETIYHNNTLFLRTKNDIYRDEGVNEISKLKLLNRGRFTAVDDLNNQYKAAQFSLGSFPQINSPLQWQFNSTSNSSLLIVPGRNDVTLAHIPMSWFHETLKTKSNKKATPMDGSSIRETFEWAVIHEPPPAETNQQDTALPVPATPQSENTPVANTTDAQPTSAPEEPKAPQAPAEAKIVNLILANSDSIEFGQSLSQGFQNAGLLEGPARHIGVRDALTEQSGLSVVPIPGTNLRLLTKWSATWSLIDALQLFKVDFAILTLLAALFLASSFAYRTRFTKLSNQLKTALIKLNPSRSVEPENSRERTLEKTFGEIFDSAVWLYKIASQRQQKYSALSDYIRSSISEERFFLTYVKERLELPNFYVMLDTRSRWRMCLLRSPYLREATSEVFFAVAADSSLARIIMLNVFSIYLERTAKSQNIEEVIKEISEQLSQHTLQLDLNFCWYTVNEEQIRGQAIQSFHPVGSSVETFVYDDEIAVFTDSDNYKAITFATYKYSPQENVELDRQFKPDKQQFNESESTLPGLSQGDVG